MLTIAGLFFFLLGLHAWIKGLSFWGLSDGSILTVSVLCIGVGSSLSDYERVGLLRAIVVCAPIIGDGLIGAFTGSDVRVAMAELLLGAFGLWLLLRMPAQADVQPGRHIRDPGEEPA